MEPRPVGLDPLPQTSHRWSVRIDGPEIQQLEARYRDRLSETERDEVVGTAAEVLAQCPDPGSTRGRRTGLVLGKVQSGKTLSYTALVALAIDNGFRITIVLAGTKNPLLEQTYARLVHDLNAGRHSLTPFKNPTALDSEVIRSILHGNGHVLAVVLKHRGRIQDITRLFGSPELRSSPALIIDDEGDEASLNTQFRRGRRSATYDAILHLREGLPFHAYIAYTATPQANLLISGIDALSPDFAVLVEPGEGYCGGSVFFGAKSDQYLRTIPVTEAQQDHAQHITESLRKAMVTFLTGAAIRTLGGSRNWHSMLVHTSNLRIDHAALQNAIRNLIRLWQETVKLPDADPAARDLWDLAKQAYDDLASTVAASPEWRHVVETLKDETWQTEVWMVNSLPFGRDPIAVPFRLRNNILVGGNMLGRGVTLEGLAVTYITREAQQETNADTLEQRARWFGYKAQYLGLCRIFLSAHLRDRYSELLQHEDDFWEALQRNQRQGLSVKEWPRMFRLDVAGWQLRPTRPSVANYKQFRGTKEWDTERWVVKDPARGQHNTEIAREFFNGHPGNTQQFGNVEHTLVRGCSPSVLISELLSKLDLAGSSWEKEYWEEYLARLELGGRLASIDILHMSCGEPRERQAEVVKADSIRVSPMQGRSPTRLESDPLYYPGDENLHQDRPQFQVHFLRVPQAGVSPDLETTALAMYLPPNPQFDLRLVVRGESEPNVPT